MGSVEVLMCLGVRKSGSKHRLPVFLTFGLSDFFVSYLKRFQGGPSHGTKPEPPY